MKIASTLAFLSLMASTVHGGLVRDLMGYGAETVSQVEEVASEVLDAVDEVAGEIQDIAAEEVLGKDPVHNQQQHQRELWTWPDDYHRPSWCWGSRYPDSFCQSRLGQFGQSIPWRQCYDTNDDCRCLEGYTLLNGQCVVQNCAADPVWFCMEQLGPNGQPRPWHYCIESVHDCQCEHGYQEVDGVCRQCASDPTWWCKTQLGQAALPRWGRSCYHVPSDCKCMNTHVNDDGVCIPNPCQQGYSYVHGQCHEEIDGCAWDPLWFCMDICGPHGIPRDESAHCVRTVNDCMCEHGTSPFDGTCVPPPSGFGDPHFITFHGHEFQFHGECDMVLVKAPSIDLDIHVRTTIRYDYSFISQAAIKLGEHVFEVGSWGEYLLDGISTPDLPLIVGKHHISVEILNDIKKKFRFTIRHADQGRSIDVVSLKDYVAVKLVNSTEADYFDAVGLMGHYAKGDMVARDGVTRFDEDPVAFGNEWQVRAAQDGRLFSDAREPQYPHERCRMPAASAIRARGRLLGESAVSQLDAEAACFEVTQHRDNCVQDVLRSKDVEMALLY